MLKVVCIPFARMGGGFGDLDVCRHAEVRTKTGRTRQAGRQAGNATVSSVVQCSVVDRIFVCPANSTPFVSDPLLFVREKGIEFDIGRDSLASRVTLTPNQTRRSASAVDLSSYQPVLDDWSEKSRQGHSFVHSFVHAASCFLPFFLSFFLPSSLPPSLPLSYLITYLCYQEERDAALKTRS